MLLARICGKTARKGPASGFCTSSLASLLEDWVDRCVKAKLRQTLYSLLFAHDKRNEKLEIIFRYDLSDVWNLTKLMPLHRIRFWRFSLCQISCAATLIIRLSRCDKTRWLDNTSESVVLRIQWILFSAELTHKNTLIQYYFCSLNTSIWNHLGEWKFQRHDRVFLFNFSYGIIGESKIIFGEYLNLLR